MSERLTRGPIAAPPGPCRAPRSSSRRGRRSSAPAADRFLDAAGVDLGRVLRVDSLTAQKRLVEAGFGIALLPVRSIPEELAAGSLVQLDVHGLRASTPVTLVTRRGSDLGPAGRTLVAALRATPDPGATP